MIKTVAYFPLQASLNSAPVLNAVIDSLQSSGYRTQENSWHSDAAVIWSVLWHGRMRGNQQVYEHYRSQNRPVIIIEIGNLYRGRTWRIAVNHITRDGHYGNHQDLDPDRPRKLGISLAVDFGRHDSVMIAAQHARSLQVASLGSMESWINQQVKLVRSVTDRPIVLRPHPRSPLHMSLIDPGVRVERPIKIPHTYDDFDMRFDHHAVINYNSGPGVQAAIAGVRPVVDQSSLASPVAVSLQHIEKPYDIDRDQWLIELCHTEYTLDEIQRSVWLKRIAPYLTQ